MNRRICLAVLGAAALVIGATAQGPGGERGQGPAPRASGFGGIRTIHGAPLLARSDVQAELKLTAAQKKSVENAMKQLGVPRPGEKRPQFDMKTAQENVKKAEATIKKTLTAAQLQRLNELSLQRMGAFAITGDEVSKKLGLTQAQRDKINKVRQDGFKKFQQQGQSGRRGPDPKITASIKKNIEAVLTSAQLAKWKAMQGKPFKFVDPPRRAD